MFYLPAYIVLWLTAMAAITPGAVRANPYSDFLGLISYPLDLVHWQTLYIAGWIGTKIGLVGDRYAPGAIAHLLVEPFLAYAVARFYETPVRLFLNRKLIDDPRGSRGKAPFAAR